MVTDKDAAAVGTDLPRSFPLPQCGKPTASPGAWDGTLTLLRLIGNAAENVDSWSDTTSPSSACRTSAPSSSQPRPVLPFCLRSTPPTIWCSANVWTAFAPAGPKATVPTCQAHDASSSELSTGQVGTWDSFFGSMRAMRARIHVDLRSK